MPDLFQSYVRQIGHIVTAVCPSDVRHPSPTRFFSLHSHTSILMIMTIPLCELSVPIVVSQVQWNRNLSSLLHTESLSVCSRLFRFRLYWTRDTTIGTENSQLFTAIYKISEQQWEERASATVTRRAAEIGSLFRQDVKSYSQMKLDLTTTNLALLTSVPLPPRPTREILVTTKKKKTPMLMPTVYYQSEYSNSCLLPWARSSIYLEKVLCVFSFFISSAYCGSSFYFRVWLFRAVEPQVPS
jgi:hypothetical protein